jgi:MYXO-CTERM domain-containing protein
MDSITNGLVVAAGEYQLTVTDFGYGTGDSGSDSYEDDGSGEYYYSSWDYYNYGGWMDITEVPAPGALSLFAVAGFARRRRRN